MVPIVGAASEVAAIGRCGRVGGLCGSSPGRKLVHLELMGFEGDDFGVGGVDGGLGDGFVL